jgi:phosphoglycerol transferase MdoB-like AlkP superfamily enzyme
MYKACRYLAKLFLFWLIFFFINRVIFLIVQISQLKHLSLAEIIRCFYYALPLDVSAACYSCAFAFIVLWIAYLAGQKIWLKILQILMVTVIFIHCAIAYGDAALYTEWHTKLSWKALAHFAHPSEVFRSASWGLTFLFFGTTIVLGLIFTVFYNRFIHLRALPPSRLKKRIFPGVVIFPIIGFIIFSGIRGGWKRFPISLSIAYYSSHGVLNDAAVNPAWSLIHDVRQEALDVNMNPYHWMPPAVATHIVDSLFHYRKDTTISVLRSPRPNIVLFILESWPRVAVQKPDGVNVTPVFDSLISQGIYFDRCYATGYVSDEGIPGILSAFPTSADVSVLTEPQKTIHLPSINEVLDSAGYNSGFIYGGQLDFGNIRSYVFNKKFGVVKSSRDFPLNVHRGALGIPDGLMAGFTAELIDKAPQPFFYCWYTLSTHPPYDIPVAKWMQYGGTQRPFINTIHYADSSLGLFFNKIKDKPWFKNTLFIFVSDHSHDSQYNRPVQGSTRNSIPLLFYGDVIKPEWRGRVMHQVTSQLDIAATLLAQLQLPHHAFPWSKNAFNPYAPHFAAINYLTGAGFITSEGFVSLEDQFPKFMMTDLTDSATIKKLKRLNQAYEQKAYHYFLKW